MRSMKCYAVVGHPIKHSLSPKIHAKFAQQLGISLSYDAIDVPVDNFSQAVYQFFETGSGLNITLPFKKQAFELAKHVTERASCAQAVNTLWVDSNHQVHGDNTDGIGLVTDIVQNLQWNIEGKHLLVAGAGGAVQGVLKPLLDAQPAMITLVNRTHEKAMNLAKRFSAFGAIYAEDITGSDCDKPYDIVINGTSTGINGQLPPIPESVIGRDTLVYDMMYGKASEAFIEWVLQQGAQSASDGLGMLLEQAAESFNIWHGVRPDTQNVLRFLRNRL